MKSIKFKDNFSIEELEEIAELKDITEYSAMNGVKIVCYTKLHDLITDNRFISDFSKDELLIILAQINSSVSFFDDIKYGDPKNLRSIYKKLKTLFIDELNNREENS